MEIWYSTREALAAALDSKHTARADAQLSRAIEAASRGIDGATHRRFWPELATRYFDWPNPSSGRAYRLWLNSNDLISVTTLTSGGTAIPAGTTGYLLRRSDDRDEPPYTHVELSTSGSASFGGGPSHQRDIAITGLWGYRNDETTAGALESAIATTSTTVVDVTNGAAVGVGSLIRVDTERMLVTGKAMLDTGQNTGGDGLTASAADTALDVTDGTAYTPGETLLVGTERLLVVDVAGNVLAVKRAWDGSTLAAHAAAVDIYAARRCTVARAVLGTTAATHLDAAAVAVWSPPSLIRDWCLAEAIAQVEQEQSGYGRTVGSGDNEREARGAGLAAIRERAMVAYARKARTRAV